MNKIEFDNHLKQNWNIYTNEEILSIPDSGNNIALLLESKQIVPDLHEWVKTHINLILDKAKYLFTFNKEILSLNERVLWCPASFSSVSDIGMHEKTKLVSMISSSKAMCEGHRRRLRILDRMQQTGIVDIYGRNINDIERFEDGAKDYMFSVAVENDQHPGYFTEKIMNCFALGTIPVYLGDPDITDWFNAEGIIKYSKDLDIKTLNESLYYSKIDAVRENFELVKKFQYSVDFNATILYNHIDTLKKVDTI